MKIDQSEIANKFFFEKAMVWVKGFRVLRVMVLGHGFFLLSSLVRLYNRAAAAGQKKKKKNT